MRSTSVLSTKTELSSSDRSPVPLRPDEETSLGELYLDLYDVPALPGTTDVYMQVYASVRAILDNEGDAPAAQVAEKAARDASAQYLEQELSLCGGDRHE